MKPNTARFVIFLISIAAIALAYLSRFQTELLRYGLLVVVALLIALVMVIKRKYLACPYCGHILGTFGFSETTCPYCGKSLK